MTDEMQALIKQAQSYEATARPREAAAAWRELSKQFIAQAQIPEALNAARHAARLQPLTPELHAELAALCLQNGRTAEAIRVWSNCARQLSAQQLFNEALLVIDAARQQIPANDALMLVEAEVLAARTGYQRTWRQKITSVRLSGCVIALGMLLLTAFGAYDYWVRERMVRACEQAKKNLSDLARLPAAEKNAALQAVIEQLRAAQPYWEFMSTPVYRESLARAQAYQQKIHGENP